MDQNLICNETLLTDTKLCELISIVDNEIEKLSNIKPIAGEYADIISAMAIAETNLKLVSVHLSQNADTSLITNKINSSLCTIVDGRSLLADFKNIINCRILIIISNLLNELSHQEISLPPTAISEIGDLIQHLIK